MAANRASSSSFCGLVEEGGVAVFGALAEMDQQRGVAAIVQDHVRRAAIGPFEDAVGVFPVVFQALALDGEDRRAAGCDRGSGVILGRIDVAGCPAHVGAELFQRFDQNRRLDRHVQRAGDARALERLLGTVFFARRHQARHLGLGEVDFLAAPIGEIDVFDGVIVRVGHRQILVFVPQADPGDRARGSVETGRDIAAWPEVGKKHIKKYACLYVLARRRRRPRPSNAVRLASDQYIDSNLSISSTCCADGDKLCNFQFYFSA